MKPKLSLVSNSLVSKSICPDAVCPDTVEALEELLEEAKDGKIIGIAFAVMYHRRQYIVDTAGAATRSPTFTRGMLATLDDALGDFIRQNPPNWE